MRVAVGAVSIPKASGRRAAGSSDVSIAVLVKHLKVVRAYRQRDGSDRACRAELSEQFHLSDAGIRSICENDRVRKLAELLDRQDGLFEREPEEQREGLLASISAASPVERRQKLMQTWADYIAPRRELASSTPT